MDKKPQLSEVTPELSQKFDLHDNALARDVKDTPKDRITLEIGDTKQPDQFHPQAKIKRWDNEVNFSARYVDPEPGEAAIETEGNVVKYIKPKVEFHAYELDPSELGEDGGLEIELLLKEHPGTNTFDFTLATKGLDFFYQPALTDEEIAEGASRPENVVGSYAVYHSTKGGMNRTDGMEYKVGKAFHIYRPFAHDANGDGIWCELNIDTETGILSVTIDPDWLEKAVYPVLVDPTFGYTSEGASSHTTSTNIDRAIGTKFSLPEDGTIIAISAFTGNTKVGDLFSGAIYDGDSPRNLRLSSAASSGSGLPKIFDVSPGVNIGSGDYYIALMMSTSGTSGARAFYYDSGVSNQEGVDTTNTDPSNPNSTYTLSSQATHKHSIYATYSLPGWPYVIPAASSIASDTSGTASTTPTMPTHQAGDILLVAAINTNSDDMSTATSGWSEITEINATGLGGHNIAWYWKRATGAGTAGPTITASGTHQFAIGYVIRGCTTNITPYEDATTSGDGETAGATSTPVTAAIDTTGDNRLVLTSYVNSSTSTWSSGIPPSGWNLESNLSSSIGDEARFTLISKLVPSAGSVSSETIGTLGLSTLYGALTLAFIPQPKTEALTDDFDDNSIDSGKWGETENNSATIVETGGQLVITPATSTATSEGVLYSQADYDLTGSYVYVEAVQVASLADGWTGMNLYLDASNEIGIEVSDETDLIAYQIVGGSFTSLASVTYNASTMRWWRIRESGGTTYWEYSADGSSWSTLHSVANPIALTAVAPGLLAYENGSDASPGQAIFDNFNVEPSGGGGTIVQDIIGVGIIPFLR